LTELPVQLAAYRRALALTAAEDKTRWEFLVWQIQPAPSPSGGRAVPIASQAQAPA